MSSPDIKIFTREETPRLTYITGLIIWDILGLKWEIITDKRKLGKYPVINYSSANIPGSCKITPDNILFEKGVEQKAITMGEWKSLPVFFLTPDNSDLPFDIFAASFYMVTRYEEYLDFQADEHGRFSASSSLAFIKGFNDIPVVDCWAKEFAKTLLRKFPSLAFRRNEYKALLSVDIDVPFAYMGRNLIRQAGEIMRDLSKNKLGITESYNVISNNREDPYETFDYIVEKAESTKTEMAFFFSVGEHSRYDKNPSWKNSRYRKLINKIEYKCISGLHPSYFAADSYSLLVKEKSHLKKIISKEVIRSRFHYLRLSFPYSYRNLIKAGISEDYSMGWHDEPGFRAGLARPYFHFDLIEDKQTTLKIVPFHFMDVTLYQYKNLDARSAWDVIIKLIDETKKAGGLFLSLWHNTTLLETPEWQEWRELFETMLNYQQPL